MPTQTRRALATLSLLTALAVPTLTACSWEVPEDQRVATALPSPTAADGTLLASAPGEFNVADKMFADMMKVHHEQAITLSDLVLAKSPLNPKVKALAEDIKAAQTPEIDTMRGWLAGWGVEPGSMGDHTAHMTGMVSQADLDKIAAADSAQAQKLFLTHMVAHHEGAVDMAQDELRQGKNPRAKELAQQIVDAQTTEIASMKALLETL